MISDDDVLRLTEVQLKYNDYLMSYPHVVGVGIGAARVADRETGEPALIVMVDRKLARYDLSDELCLPHELEGVRIDVQEMGNFFAS